MEKFNGKKFYPTNERMVRNEQVWWTDEYEEKVDFQITSTYKAYLRKKRAQERETAIQVLKHKLEYQMREYGEVDPIDFGEFMAYVQGLK